ncbi:gas vesicle protein [Streptomyces sp. SID8361]|uniref:gas vesicle protein GvpO n=1 Tax=Streptomyces sp. MnatMP-M27 TaxID=1839768 RepID=UPI00081EC826|nr:gas vesicle protein GvpO [Streptomyces sp. MnatMP-M27]MYU11277.1 gas vesicle protein [Streptomyces sp. SID8361]SCF79979.1 Gas vesicle synthesis protein GvpO [Streptomyces sp. MnatMP-M27]
MPRERPREEGHREERPRARTHESHEVRDRHERPRRRPALDARDAARSAARHVAGLTGRTPEGVTSLERREDGWSIGIEIVETHRIPDSTDILAEYRVELDGRGELVSYRRTERYYRGRAEDRT